MRTSWLSVAAVVAVCGFSGSAQGRSGFVSMIPNGSVQSCSACHTSVPAFNAFGSAVAGHLSGGSPDWPALFALDSDGDGFTNGEELGDPCGQWRPGSAPASTAGITAPGNGASVPAQHSTASCAPATGGTGTGTSSSSSSSSSGGATAPTGCTGEECESESEHGSEWEGGGTGAEGGGDNDSGGSADAPVGGCSSAGSTPWAAVLLLLVRFRRRAQRA